VWRDPLEELIENLERALPQLQTDTFDLFPLAELSRITDVILYGTDEEIDALETDVYYQRLRRDMRRMREPSNAAPDSAPGLALSDHTVQSK
jgi:hypothetical protein